MKPMLIDYEIMQPFVERSKKDEAYMLKIIEMSLKYAVFKECFGVIYSKLIPIEMLPQEEKQGLWEFVKEKYPTRSKQDKIQLCKSVYVMGTLF
jgi:hypothetical protein